MSGKLIYFVLLIKKKQNRTLLLSLTKKHACIMDWAMKYLPQHYRKQMSEFFGKRGKSWHISAVITRSQEEGRCEVECFVHLFNTCKQNRFAVMSVIEHLHHTIKIVYPSINN